MIDLNKAAAELIELGAKHVEVYPNAVWWDQCSYLTKKGGVYKGRGISLEMQVKTYYGDHMELLTDEKISELGIKDITNLKPHEYGMLKIKYGLTRLDMYLPEELRGESTNG